MLNLRSGSSPDVAKVQESLARAGVSADCVAVPSVMGVGSVDHLAAEYDRLIAAGGDGTVSSVAAAAARSGRTLGVIPCGTLNHFARDAGIPLDLDAAVQVLAEGRTRLFDTGVLNDRIFINNASIGAYPRMVWTRNRARERGLPRPIALTVAVTRTWFELRSMTVRLDVDGRELVRRTPFIFVGNSEYEVHGTEIGRRPTMTDGKLSLYMAPRFGRLDALLVPALVLMKKLETHERFEAIEAMSIAIETAERRVAAALDGEVHVFSAPLRFGVRRQSLRVIVPRGGED